MISLKDVLPEFIAEARKTLQQEGVLSYMNVMYLWSWVAQPSWKQRWVYRLFCKRFGHDIKELTPGLLWESRDGYVREKCARCDQSREWLKNGVTLNIRQWTTVTDHKEDSYVIRPGGG